MKVHKLIYKNGKKFYLCNQAIKPINERKYSFQWKNVNCINCLKQKMKTITEIKIIALWCNGSTMDSCSLGSVRIRHERLGEKQ